MTSYFTIIDGRLRPSSALKDITAVEALTAAQDEDAVSFSDSHEIKFKVVSEFEVSARHPRVMAEALFENRKK